MKCEIHGEYEEPANGVGCVDCETEERDKEAWFEKKETTCEICKKTVDRYYDRYERILISTQIGYPDEWDHIESHNVICIKCYVEKIKPAIAHAQDPAKFKPIAFSKKFKKLEQGLFSTIRMKNHDYKRGQIRNVALRGNRLIGKVRILSCHERKLATIPDSILIKDCETKTRSEAIVFLKKFYPEITENSTVFYLILKWEKEAIK